MKFVLSVVIVAILIIAANTVWNHFRRNKRCFLCWGSDCVSCILCWKCTACEKSLLCVRCTWCKECIECEDCINCTSCFDCHQIRNGTSCMCLIGNDKD